MKEESNTIELPKDKRKDLILGCQSRLITPQVLPLTKVAPQQV